MIQNNTDLRKKLGGVQPTAESKVELIPEWNWFCGEDLPITWSKKELRKMRKKTLKANYKSGCITKAQYKASRRKGDK